MRAYRAEAAVRDAAKERLRRHAGLDALVPGPLAWHGAAGSLVGCLLESDDLGRWEGELGLPQWLAIAADGIAADEPSAAAALAFGLAMLDAIRPGADVTPAGSAVIVHALEDAAVLIGQLTAVPAELAGAMAAVQRLHRRAQAGERPGPAEWRAARRAALAQTDAQATELLKSLATCVETAAWDPATSKAVVFDVLRVYGRAASQQAEAAAGFTQEMDAHIRGHLQRMWDTYLADDPELQQQGVTVFSLLERHHPDVAATIRWKSELDEETFAVAQRRAVDTLIAQLQRA